MENKKSKHTKKKIQESNKYKIKKNKSKTLLKKQKKKRKSNWKENWETNTKKSIEQIENLTKQEDVLSKWRTHRKVKKMKNKKNEGIEKQIRNK